MNDFFKLKIESKIGKKNTLNNTNNTMYQQKLAQNENEVNKQLKMLKLNLLVKTPVKETKKDVTRIIHSPLISDNVKLKLNQIINTVNSNNQSRNKVQYMSSHNLSKNEHITNSNKDKINQKKREIFKILEFDSKQPRTSSRVSRRNESTEEENRVRINRMKNKINNLINEDVMIFDGSLNISKIKYDDKKDTSGSDIRRFLDTESDKKNSYRNEGD
jgi:hypothetical protein